MTDHDLRKSSVTYLDHAAGSEPGRAHKQRMIDAMDLRSGQTALDVGCGPGTDLTAVAEAVGATGSVIGVDADPVMIVEAARRSTSLPQVRVLLGDAHRLPILANTVDRARLDRVAQHLVEPARAFAEVRRVLCPGGRLAVTEPDWDTLVVDDLDTETTRAYTRFVATRVVRNGAIGRALPRLAIGAGLTVRDVAATAVVFTDFAAAEPILKLTTVMPRAVESGAVHADAANRWLERRRTEPFLAAFTVFTLVATKPS